MLSTSVPRQSHLLPFFFQISTMHARNLFLYNFDLKSWLLIHHKIGPWWKIWDRVHQPDAYSTSKRSWAGFSMMNRCGRPRRATLFACFSIFDNPDSPSTTSNSQVVMAPAVFHETIPQISTFFCKGARASFFFFSNLLSKLRRREWKEKKSKLQHFSMRTKFVCRTESTMFSKKQIW